MGALRLVFAATLAVVLVFSDVQGQGSQGGRPRGPPANQPRYPPGRQPPPSGNQNGNRNPPGQQQNSGNQNGNWNPPGQQQPSSGNQNGNWNPPGQQQQQQPLLGSQVGWNMPNGGNVQLAASQKTDNNLQFSMESNPPPSQYPQMNPNPRLPQPSANPQNSPDPNPQQQNPEDQNADPSLPSALQYPDNDLPYVEDTNPQYSQQPYNTYDNQNPQDYNTGIVPPMPGGRMERLSNGDFLFHPPRGGVLPVRLGVRVTPQVYAEPTGKNPTNIAEVRDKMLVNKCINVPYLIEFFKSWGSGSRKHVNGIGLIDASIVQFVQPAIAGTYGDKDVIINPITRSNLVAHLYACLERALTDAIQRNFRYSNNELADYLCGCIVHYIPQLPLELANVVCGTYHEVHYVCDDHKQLVSVVPEAVGAHIAGNQDFLSLLFGGLIGNLLITIEVSIEQLLCGVTKAIHTIVYGLVGLFGGQQCGVVSLVLGGKLGLNSLTSLLDLGGIVNILHFGGGGSGGLGSLVSILPINSLGLSGILGGGGGGGGGDIDITKLAGGLLKSPKDLLPTIVHSVGGVIPGGAKLGLNGLLPPPSTGPTTINNNVTVTGGGGGGGGELNVAVGGTGPVSAGNKQSAGLLGSLLS